MILLQSQPLSHDTAIAPVFLQIFQASLCPRIQPIPQPLPIGVRHLSVTLRVHAGTSAAPVAASFGIPNTAGAEERITDARIPANLKAASIAYSCTGLPPFDTPPSVQC